MMKALKETGLEIEDQSHLNNYDDVNIKKSHDGSYEFSHFALIASILDDIHLNNWRKVKIVCMSSLNHLYAPAESKPFYECHRFQFNYCSAIGKLNCIAQTSRSEHFFAVHQHAQFSVDPKKDPCHTIMYLCMHLNAPKSQHSASNQINP